MSSLPWWLSRPLVGSVTVKRTFPPTSSTVTLSGLSQNSCCSRPSASLNFPRYALPCSNRCDIPVAIRFACVTLGDGVCNRSYSRPLSSRTRPVLVRRYGTKGSDAADVGKVRTHAQTSAIPRPSAGDEGNCGGQPFSGHTGPPDERESLVLLPKGNGKTTLMAAIALWYLTETPEAKIYCAASSIPQARILFEHDVRRRGREPTGAGRVGRLVVTRRCLGCRQRIARGSYCRSCWPSGGRWGKTRDHIRRRDQTCRNCGSTTGLQVHHRQPVSAGGSHNVSNLVLLCRRCHADAHQPFL